MKKTNIIAKGIKYFSDKDYRTIINARLGMYDRLPDDKYLKKLFKAYFHKELNLENPVTFNEKLQWLKLYNRKPEYTMMVDKYKVREYIAQTLGEEYLIPLLGVWDDPDEIDFDALPDQFVLKCNHNSGLGMCICKDKSKLDIERVKNILREGLKQDYYLTGREWPYKDVPRKIICEKYMEDTSVQPCGSESMPAISGGLSDYKIHSFNGVPEVILVCRNRFSELGLTEDFFDQGWTHLNVQREEHPNSSTPIAQPKELEDMLRLAETLSKDVPLLRSDFYTVGGKVYFGELTFFPASGFEKFVPETFDKLLGDWITLPSAEGGVLTNGRSFLFIHEEPTTKNSTGNLTDYKFFCFDGYVDCVMVCLERSSGETKFYFFDKDWNLKRINVRGKNAPEGFTIPKPECMDAMFDIAATLSKGLPFARIDLYQSNHHIYFGEITFFPDSGFDTNLLPETDEYFGNLIDLGRIKK